MTVRVAGREDLADLGVLLGKAFQEDPISSWLFPDESRRLAVQPAFFQAFVTVAVDAGGVIYVRDKIAATVWFASSENADGDFMARFDMLTVEETEHFGHLASLMAENHPTRGEHMHLQFIAVHPDHQRTGVGGELLDHNLAILDSQGMPAYLEASSAVSPPLYQRKGFEHIGTPFGPGPKMYPMWREPRR